MAALLRYFRDLDLAEEAYQEACLRALRHWPRNGPPRNAEAWLVMVGRNAALDQLRRRTRQTELPPGDAVPDQADGPDLAERLDAADYRDDILRLLFICCHPELPATQQIALALRIVSGLPVERIARAFLVAPRAMEQRITRAKARIARAEIPFDAPGPVERAQRFAAVAAMIYLVFNEGYTDANPASERAALCDEAIRLARLLLRLFPAEPEMMGLLALMLIQHSRQAARFDAEGGPVLLEDQDRGRWNRAMIAEALAMLDKAMLHRRPGPYQIQAAIAALHARAARPEETDWAGIDRLYAALERHAPSPVVTLNRAVAVMKLQGAEAALEMVEPLRERLDGYFYLHGRAGRAGRRTLALLDRAGAAETMVLPETLVCVRGAHGPASGRRILLCHERARGRAVREYRRLPGDRAAAPAGLDRCLPAGLGADRAGLHGLACRVRAAGGADALSGPRHALERGDPEAARADGLSRRLEHGRRPAGDAGEIAVSLPSPCSGRIRWRSAVSSCAASSGPRRSRGWRRPAGAACWS
nr:RNA polymerase sigma factor [Paracoccus sp. J55]